MQPFSLRSASLRLVAQERSHAMYALCAKGLQFRVFCPAKNERLPIHPTSRKESAQLSCLRRHRPGSIHRVIASMSFVHTTVPERTRPREAPAELAEELAEHAAAEQHVLTEPPPNAAGAAAS